MNIASYDELFDQSKCPIFIFTSGNNTKSHIIQLQRIPETAQENPLASRVDG